MNKFALVLTILVAAQANAEESTQVGMGQRAFVAALAGPALFTSTGGGNYFSFGGRIGFTIGQSSEGIGSLGLALSTLSNSETVSGIKVDGAITFLGVEYVARKAWGSGFYFGARVGLGLNNVTATSGSLSINGSDNVFAFAPVLGFEYPITGNANLIFDTSWVNIGGGTFTFGTSSLAYERSAVVLLHAGIGLEF